MTKPTSRLNWFGDPVDPHTIRAVWVGAGWHYTLKWGDGTQDRVLAFQPPAKHTYPRAGLYTIVGISDLHADITISARVAIRDKLKPDLSFALLDDRRTVRATLPRLDEEVRYRINWGDNSTPTEHDVHDLTPTHEYAWGTGAPVIVVEDLPARRTGRFTGPEIGPEPPAREYRGFVIEHVETTDDYREYVLHGGGLTPGSAVLAYPWKQERYWHLTADAEGRIAQKFSISRMPNWATEWEHVWRSVTVQHDGGITHVPFHPAFEHDTPQLMYHVNPDDPRELTFTAFPPQQGEHVIKFGNGQSRRVNVDTLPLLATYRYPGAGTQFTAELTLPDGRTASRLIKAHPLCPPCFTDGNPGQFDASWYITGNWCGACGAGGGDPFAPIQWSVSGKAGGWEPLQLHKTTDDTDQGWHTTYIFHGFPVGTYTVTYVKPLVPVERHTVTVTKASKIKATRRFEEARNPDTTSDLTAWFGNVTEWDGGYRGEFTVTNHQPDSPVWWVVEFELAAPAVLREVWPSTARYQDLGGGRWRIWSTQPVGATPAVAGARIEPPGKTKRYPEGITARPYTPPPPDNSSTDEGGATP